MKVLISAYACEPGKGSEPEVGWQWVHQVARFHETWVITRANNRKTIERAIGISPVNNLYFIYYDLPDWARFWKKKNRGIHIYHQLWQYKILPIVQKLHQEHKFDICHHVTFGVVWHPSYFFKLPDTKMIWGPFGGGESAYEACVKDFSLRGKLIESLRRVLSTYFFRFDPFVRKNFRKASLLLARTDMTAQKIPTPYLSKSMTFLETGFGNLPKFERNFLNDKKHFFTMSRLIPLKNIKIAILAMQLISDEVPSAKLHIYGDGPLMGSLQTLVKKLNLGDNIYFYGNISHDKLTGIIKTMDILLHPSVREGGSHAIMEALAYGIPVVCIDNAGPGYMVDENCGIKINGKNNDEIVSEFAGAAIRLLTDKEYYKSLSCGARAKVSRQFLWEQIGNRLNTLYQKVYQGQIGS